MTPPLPAGLILGCVLCYGALTLVVFFVVAPPRPRNMLNRRGTPGTSVATPLNKLAGGATNFVDYLLRRRNLTFAVGTALVDAGVRVRPAEFIILIASGGVILAGAGLLAGGPILALVLAAAVPLIARFGIGALTSKRRKRFADQLDDTLQLLAGGLRAGHSLLRAIDAVSADSEAPASEEFTRIVNETRLGRDLGEALDDAAERMRSEDFSWVAQAIAIHREVGGNLANVLDQVGQTIRERNQIRRQVAALSAEGKMSAIILMVLPFALSGILLFISPGYMDPLFQSPVGLVLIAVSVVLLSIGALWLRNVVKFRF